MTARVRRRKHRTVFAVVITGALLATAAVLVAVGATTLLDSEEGEAVAVDERPVVALPETPNGLLAVADRQGRLTSVVIATRDPSGVGGSIVTVPVNADANAGFANEAIPLDTVFDPNDVEPLREAVEGMFAISIERAAIVDADQLTAILEPIETIDVDLPEDVVDASAPGTGIVASEGPQRLRQLLIVDVLTAFDDEGPAYDHHDVDAEVWSGIAATAPTLPPRDDPEVPPETVGDLFADLWRGPVDARDLALSVVVAETDETDGPTVDSVVVDRRDAVMVFAQVSPGLMSQPNPALSFRVISRFNEEQLEASDGLFDSNAELTRRFIGELLFVKANVVSVDTAVANEGAREITLVEVADPRFLDDLEQLAEAAFGEAEIVEATTIIEGVDVVVTLGTSYVDFRTDLAESSAGDSDETEAGDPATSDPETSEPATSEPAESESVTTDTATVDTVADG